MEGGRSRTGWCAGKAGEEGEEAGGRAGTSSIFHVRVRSPITGSSVQLSGDADSSFRVPQALDGGVVRKINVNK